VTELLSKFQPQFGKNVNNILQLNNRLFFIGLIVVPRRFNDLKTNVCPRCSRANMLTTLNFLGATIRPIVSRHKHSIVFIVNH